MNETDATDAEGADAADSSDGTLCTGVVTIASSRSLENDRAGEVIAEVLEESGNGVTVREHVGANHDKVQSIVSRLIDRDDVDIVLTAGATGVEPTDTTIEAVKPLLEKELTAFSELFTALAYEQVGTEVITARTLAGITEGTPVFCLPGHADAVRLALAEIILQEAARIIDLAEEDEPDGDADEAASGEPTEADAADGGA
ncbi:MogA/MoaB family molybdenum cofactor biosynthesis protein [Natrinema versiforme]|uniref:Molybdopterin binding domain protein n=1 Tax=Natrinema versiforme JCM 10478 TaxID=1227496 RepID=L9Y408_9EURY|nr:molybdopterin-binding protein [Natrinema versiforme]ELY68442.1 molybdopterin binding domain protein [Natrinema versiforme JCM 10478]